VVGFVVGEVRRVLGGGAVVGSMMGGEATGGAEGWSDHGGRGRTCGSFPAGSRTTRRVLG
jgi:hypothetical protein